MTNSSKKKRVLFVSPQFPHDFSSSVYGGFQRMRMWLDAIVSLEADVDILFFPNREIAAEPYVEFGVSQRLAELWQIRCNVVICRRGSETRRAGRLAPYIADYILPTLGLAQHPYFKPYAGTPQREAFAECLSRSPDIIFFHRLNATMAARSLPRSWPEIFIDLDDVEHRRFAREVAQPPRWRLKPLLYLQVPGLWWGERAAIAWSTSAFVCSEVDRRYLWRTMRVRNVEVIPNAVPKVADGALATEPNVLFIGAYSYAPNIVAAECLIEEVRPHLARICPKVRILIAGPRSEEIPSFHNPPTGVEFLGFVSDLATLYRRARVVCCPIQSGGGTRIKILEAASYGVPVVSTPLGAEGLEFVPDEEILLRKGASGLATGCADLLLEDALAHRIGAAGRDRVRTLYDRDVIISKMRTILGRALGLRQGGLGDTSI